LAPCLRLTDGLRTPLSSWRRSPSEHDRKQANWSVGLRPAGTAGLCFLTQVGVPDGVRDELARQQLRRVELWRVEDVCDPVPHVLPSFADRIRTRSERLLGKLDPPLPLDYPESEGTDLTHPRPRRILGDCGLASEGISEVSQEYRRLPLVSVDPLTRC
jgi:hypothetical protein